MFGPDFFAKNTSSLERTITLIHEFTHFPDVYGTIPKDEHYGVIRSMNRAAEGPTMALANGDNWALMAATH